MSSIAGIGEMRPTGIEWFDHLGQTSPRGFEIAGIRGRLVLARRHQITVAGEVVEFPCRDDDIDCCSRCTGLLGPQDSRSRRNGLTTVQGRGERVVDGGDLGNESGLCSCFVERDALVDDRTCCRCGSGIAARLVDACP